MTDRAVNYSAGFSMGETWGTYDDTFARAMLPEVVADARERAATALLDTTRAFWLGVLRGYRAVTR